MSHLHAVEPVPGGRETAPQSDGKRPLIEFSGVAKRFFVDGESRPAVEDVELAVHPGEIVTLVGPSGCGKSTLLNMAAGPFRTHRGSVRYGGAAGDRAESQRRLHDPTRPPAPMAFALENVALPLELRGDSRARRPRARGADRLVGLEGLSAIPVAAFRRDAKALRAGATARVRPRNLAPDEPFGALDAQLRLGLQAEVLRIVRRLARPCYS